MEESLMNDGFQFRQLLDKHGLVELAGGESDALDWLETQIIELADSVSRKQRFLKLVRQVREELERGQQREWMKLGKEIQQRENHPDSEQKRRANPYAPRGFRRIRI